MAKIKFMDAVKALGQKKMAVNLLLGFSAGIPFLLVSRTLQAWVSYTGGSNVLVGVLAAISIPYTFKFLWAPFLDRFELPFLGRRRGWLLLTQISLLLAIIALSRTEPTVNLQLTMILSVTIAFLGATQDILVDAYRRESLKDEELGLGSSVYTMGYRTAMWFTGGAALILAHRLSWNTSYLIMSSLVLLGIFATVWAAEPQASPHRPQNMKEAIIAPLKEFFSRKGVFLILAFILVYKMGDALAGNMLNKFYADLKFTPEEVGLIAKTMGPFAVVAGTFLGGLIIYRLGIIRSLFIFGILQAASTLSFVLLNNLGHNIPAFTGVIFFEDFTAGMGSAAFMAFMASMTNRAFTATQYALLTSLMAVPRTFFAVITGFLVDALGWNGYFATCAAIAIPGLVILVFLNRSLKQEPLVAR
jgi:MFS transporter, PAT family, beta-lactamase induction signal transducer AmpG